MKKRSLYSDQRIGVFVDVQNLYYSARHLYNSKLDFGNILETAVQKRRLIRAIAYVVRADKSSDSDLGLPGSERSFFDALEAIGFDVKAKDLQVYGGGFKKGDWDVGIAMDAIEHAPKLDTVVLISGDGDYVPLVEHLRRALGCRVEVMAFGRSTSSKLKDACDEFVDMDKNSVRFLIKGRRSSESELNEVNEKEE
jgi:uncharacterized LabA/DUF88 family protein